MFKRRYTARFLILCLPVLLTLSAAEPILLGRHKVHPTRIVARFAPGVNANTANAFLQEADLEISKSVTLVPGLVALDVPAALKGGANLADPAGALLDKIAALQRTGQFAYVEPDYIVSINATPTDARFVDGTLWGLRNLGQNGGVRGADIGVTNAWDLTTGSTNVLVAVIDTGIRYTHVDLAAQMWRNPGEIPGNGIDDDGDGYVDNVFGINAITGSGDPFDDNDHGTHVSGTIGAQGNGGGGHVGVAWTLRLMGCKFLSAAGSGSGFDAIECIDFAVKKGASILNNSWGGGGFSQALFDSISAARDAGVLFVAAAGNSANDNDTFPAYPASYQLDNIIAVAALDRRDSLAVFSNYGRTNVHIGAPGVEIYSSTAGSDTDYQVFQGTSMAAPHVAGVAALLKSYHTNATYTELRERILLGSVPIPSLRNRVSTGGRLNAYRAMVGNPDGLLEVSVSPPPGTPLLVGTNLAFFVTVNDVFGVTNATVTGFVAGVTNNMTFVNDGLLNPDKVANDQIYSAYFAVPFNPGPLTLTLTVTAPGKSNFIGSFSYNAIIPPPNDNFADATKIAPEGGLFDGDNRFATIETGEPFHAGLPTASGSLWWVWAPRTNSPVLIDTAGSSFDTALAVYVGNSLLNLKEVISTNDVGLKKQGYAGFTATNGVSYRIAVAGISGSEKGAVRLRVEPRGQPDTNAPNVTITYPPNGLVVTNVDGKITITGTAVDPQPNVSGVRDVTVQINNDIASSAIGTTNWNTLPQLLIEGVNTINVRASDFAENVSAPKQIFVTFRPANAPNDLFGKALPLIGDQGVSVISNQGAGKEFGEPKHAGNDGGRSLWWTFQPPTDGILYLSTAGSGSLDTLLGLYTGNLLSNLKEIASSDDTPGGAKYSELTHSVVASELYHIAVDGFDGATGTVQLAYAFSSASTFNFTISSTAGGSVSPGSGNYPSNATVLVTATPDRYFEFAGFFTPGANGVLISAQNPLAIVLKSNTNLTARFAPHTFTDDFESGALNHIAWESTTWQVQTNVVSRGVYAASSGITGNGQSHSLKLAGQMRAGVGSFEFRVSSEDRWDKLEFLTNGVLSASWSGDLDWSTYTFDLGEGMTTLEWRYLKDSAVTIGLDAAFIDNLDLPLSVAVGARPSIKIVSGGGNQQIQITGQPGQQYVIQSATALLSDGLTKWTPISTNVANSAGLVLQTDPEGGSTSVRFYRALVKP